MSSGIESVPPARAGAVPVQPVEVIRSGFPALARRHEGSLVAYFDGPGGTQIPRAVVDAMREYLFGHNANTHWAYPSSAETDAALRRRRPFRAASAAGRPRARMRFPRLLGIQVLRAPHRSAVGPARASRIARCAEGLAGARRLAGAAGGGTQNHEGIVGAAAAVDFLASLAAEATLPRRAALERTFAALQDRGRRLFERLWQGLGGTRGVSLYGPPPDAPRTPTLSFTVAGRFSEEIAVSLVRRGVFVSNGDFYAATAIARIGHAADGVVRAGCACYTTEEEVDRLVDGVRAAAKGEE